jgi:hypothetical protein
LSDTQAFVASDRHLFVFTVVLPLLFHIFCRNNHVVRNNTKPYIFKECYATSHEMIPVIYCDMTPESGKCAVREAQQRHLLLDNGKVNIVPAEANEYMDYRGNGYAD